MDFRHKELEKKWMEYESGANGRIFCMARDFAERIESILARGGSLEMGAEEAAIRWSIKFGSTEQDFDAAQVILESSWSHWVRFRSFIEQDMNAELN